MRELFRVVKSTGPPCMYVCMCTHRASRHILWDWDLLASRLTPARPGAPCEAAPSFSLSFRALGPTMEVHRAAVVPTHRVAMLSSNDFFDTTWRTHFWHSLQINVITKRKEKKLDKGKSFLMSFWWADKYIRIFEFVPNVIDSKENDYLPCFENNNNLFIYLEIAKYPKYKLWVFVNPRRSEYKCKIII